MRQQVMRTGLAAGFWQRAVMQLNIVARLPASSIPSVLALSVRNAC